MGSKMMMMMGLACCCCCCVLLCSGGGAGAYTLRNELGLANFFDELMGGGGGGTVASDDTTGTLAPGTTSGPATMAEASKEQNPVIKNNNVKDIHGNPTHIEYGDISDIKYILTAVGDKGGAGGDDGKYYDFNVLDSHKGESPVWLERSQHAESVRFMRNDSDPTGKSCQVLVNETLLANGKFGSNDDTCDYAGRYHSHRHADKNRYAWSLVPDAAVTNSYRLASKHCKNKELLVFDRMPSQSTLVPVGLGTRFLITAR